MQRLTLTIPVGDKTSADTFRVFANVDHAGRATESIDYSQAITGAAAQPFGTPRAIPADRKIRTPRLYHGEYRFAIVSYDPVGNASAGTPSEFGVLVISGPQPTRRFRLMEVAAGRPVFGFDPPPQFVED